MNQHVHTTSQFAFFITFLGLLASFPGICFSDDPEIIRVPEDAPTIEEAIQQARDKDVISIAPGEYEGNLSVEGLELTFAAQTEGSPPLLRLADFPIKNASVAFQNIDFTFIYIYKAGQTGLRFESSNAIIRNATLTGMSASRSGGYNEYIGQRNLPPLVVANTQDKDILIENCIIQGGREQDLQRTPAFLIDSCTDTTFVISNTSIIGGYPKSYRSRAGGTLIYYDYFPNGDLAWQIRDCLNLQIQLNNSKAKGGKGLPTKYGSEGGIGLWIERSSLTMIDGRIEGGDGGNGDDSFGSTGGAGGTGLVVRDHSNVRLENTAVQSGYGGHPQYSQNIEIDVDDTSTLVRDPIPYATPTPTPTVTPTPTQTPTVIPFEALEVVTVQIPGLPEGAVPLEMVRIPAGTAMLGSPLDMPQRGGDLDHKEYVIEEDFYIGRYEVTQAQWKAVLGDNPVVDYANFNPEFVGDNYPVFFVCRLVDIDMNLDRFTKGLTQLGLGQFKLPSEIQWEYACRAGTIGSRFSFGDIFECDDTSEHCEALDPYVWWAGNSATDEKEAGPHEVGQKLPNPWGLYDIYGNMREWCADYWSPMPFNSPFEFFVVRGGGWNSRGVECRSGHRDRIRYNHLASDLGFRVIRKIDPPLEVTDWIRY